MSIRSLRMGPACYHVLHVLPPMVAHEMNFFVDEGLVDQDGWPAYELLPGGIAPFNAEKVSLAQSMKEKGAHVAMDVKPSTVVYLNARGAGLRIIAGWRNQQPSWVMGAPGIESLADLRDRVVALKDFGNVRYYALAHWLRQAGLDPKADVRYVRGHSNGPAALRSGEADAAFILPRDTEGLLREGFTKLLDIREQYPGGRPDRIVVATQQVIDERPEWVMAFVKGLIRSYWLMRTMPENLFYLSRLERRMRLTAHDPDERVAPLQCAAPRDCEQMPFPIDGLPSGFEEYLSEWAELGELEPSDVEQLQCSLRLDITRAAFAELAARPDLAAQVERMRALTAELGY